MDLLNTAVLHHERQGVDVRLDTCIAPISGESFACPDAAGHAARAINRHLPHAARNSAVLGYLDRLFAMLGFMGSAAMGPNGPHAHFLRHSVDSLTIRSLGAARRNTSGTGQRASAPASAAVSTTAAVLSIVRGVSNLEEELHHSFFSYLMLSTTAFVSIGEFTCISQVSVCCWPCLYSSVLHESFSFRGPSFRTPSFAAHFPHNNWKYIIIPPPKPQVNTRTRWCCCWFRWCSKDGACPTSTETKRFGEVSSLWPLLKRLAPSSCGLCLLGPSRRRKRLEHTSKRPILRGISWC